MSLYLKYRPKDFESLVWQAFIKKTLQKALAEDKIVSSYLLCWPRGTGKTTTARILAAWLNCTDLRDGNPCHTCENCKAFWQESLIDIIEIDAASHTWVDNIREIIERAQFQPTTAQYKVYIIDEVHMLSKWAFNALLKILEEPPKHVKFILATTETHKVPETIISRCQRYDFKSISIKDIESRLQEIADLEWVSIDKSSLWYIAKSSWWALRNAISLFEQMIEDNKIEYERLIEKLWLSTEETITSIYDKLLQTDLSVMQDLSQLSNEWKNMQLFYSELLDHAKIQALENLDAPQIQERIHILTQLNKGLWEMKYCYDPEVTTLSMLSQILWIYREYIPKVVEKEREIPQVSPSLPSFDAPEQVTAPTMQETITDKNTLSHDDVDDIFWGTLEETHDTQTISQETQANNSGDFDKEKYIEILRSMKVKWALIISLKQARNFRLLEDSLEIVLQNNFTLKALNTWDNILDLIKWLEKMWIDWKTVKLC